MGFPGTGNRRAERVKVGICRGLLARGGIWLYCSKRDEIVALGQPWTDPDHQSPRPVPEADRALAAAVDAVLDPRAPAATPQPLPALTVEEAVALRLQQRCATVGHAPRILDLVADLLQRLGVAGEARAVTLLYLAILSRLLPRPVSAKIVGPSSLGKSFVMTKTLMLFPEDAVFFLSAASERALLYSHEPLRHRVLVLAEAAGLKHGFQAYLVRTLLSEGRLRYETVVKGEDGPRTVLVERDGPTGLIVTTTCPQLDAELETRLLTIPLTATEDQTRQILLALAQGPSRPKFEDDLAAFHALQAHLAQGPRQVSIPFAADLARLMPATPLRVRRDFSTLLTLIKAHALLHRESRATDEQTRIVATLEDYEVVYSLVADLLCPATPRNPAATVTETVAAVRSLQARGVPEPTVTQLGNALGIDKSTALRRTTAAIAAGLLANLTTQRGAQARLAIPAALPATTGSLPTPERLRGCIGCATPPDDAPQARSDPGAFLRPPSSDAPASIEPGELLRPPPQPPAGGQAAEQG